MNTDRLADNLSFRNVDMAESNAYWQECIYGRIQDCSMIATGIKKAIANLFGEVFANFLFPLIPF